MAMLIELLVILAWITFWFLVSTSGMGTTVMQFRWYQQYKSQITASPPSWVFGVVWPILYALLIAASSIYMIRADGEPYYEVSFVLLVVNGLLNYIWYPSFFKARQFRAALLLIFGMIGTALSLVILWGIAEHYLPMGLVIPYVVWLCFAAFLNYQWTRVKIPQTPKLRPK